MDSPERVLERRIVTVLFCDLVGFTQLCEDLDHEDVATIQDAYFDAVRAAVDRYSGQLEKFIGDAAVGVFGIPRVRDDDAERAVRAGMALVRAVEQIEASLDLDPGTLRVRVAVNTGEVIYGVGDTGSERGPVTGDTVNVASRLQSAARPGGVIVGAATALAVSGAIDLEDAGSLELKGKAEPVRAWHAVGVRSHPSREHSMGSLRAPMLGRSEELRKLLEAFGRVREGSMGGLKVLVAPPGVGKSRLVEEFARIASVRNTEMGTEPAAVWWCRFPPEVVAPFEAVGQLVLAALSEAGLAPHGHGNTSRWRREAVEPLRARLRAEGVPDGRAAVVTEELLKVARPAPDQETSRRAGFTVAERKALFGAWLEGLDALAGGRMSLWIVEDIHWAGGDFLAFLTAASGVEPGAANERGRRLVLATARPSLLDDAAAWLAPSPDSAGGSPVIELGPLSSPDAGALVTALVGDALPAPLVRKIAERSDGNPLFIEELLRTWVSIGVLEASHGKWRLASWMDEVSLPTTVQAIYAAQLDDLPSAARDLARRAAVAGRHFPDLALTALGVSDPAAGLRILGRRALIARRDPDPVLGPAHAFRHALLRDVGYGSLARADRARLHVRIARWLEKAAAERGGLVAELIGNHYRAALEATPALASEVGEGVDRQTAALLAAAWFERAAEAALEVAASDAAVSLFRRSLELSFVEEPLIRARRLERLGETLASAASMDEGADAVQESVTLSGRELEATGSTDARRGHATALATLGWIRINQLRFADAIDMAEKGIRLIGEHDDEETARLLILRAAARYAVHNRMGEDIPRIIGIARSTANSTLELDALETFVGMRVYDRRVFSDVDWTAMLETARRASRWSSACGVLQTEALARIGSRPEMSVELLDRADDIALARRLTEALGWSDYIRIEASLAMGELDLALEAGLRTADLAERNGYARLAVRTWFAVVPTAARRADRTILDRGWAWWEPRRGRIPQSPFGALMTEAVEICFQEQGYTRADERPPDALLPSFQLALDMPSFLAAEERVVERWLSLGAIAAAEDALAAIAATNAATGASGLALCSESLVRARVEAARGADGRGVASRVETARKQARAVGSYGWEERCDALLITGTARVPVGEADPA